MGRDQSKQEAEQQPETTKKWAKGAEEVEEDGAEEEEKALA